MNVYIYLRGTEDWANVKLEDCVPPSPGHKGLKYISLLKEWNREFSIPWTKFRHLLHEKAVSTWTLPVLEEPHEVKKLNDEDVIIPIDDDDWLHPDIESFVKDNMRDHDLLHWPQIVNGHDVHNYLWGTKEWHRDLIYCSSDHALRVKHLKTLSNHRFLNSLHGHSNLRDTFFNSERRFVPKAMSCYNTHIGSHSVLSFFYRIEEVRIKALNFCDKKIPDYAKWAEELIYWLDDLTNKTVAQKITYL